MKESKSESKPEKLWQKTQYRNLIRYVPSGTFYGRVRVAGKLIRRSLKTDSITTAKLRLADMEKDERQTAARGTEVRRGKLKFDDAAKVVIERIQADPNLKPRTKAYYKERLECLYRSWPELAGMDARRITKSTLMDWQTAFVKDNSPTSFNHTVGLLRRVLDVAIVRGSRYDNPAQLLKRVRERPKQIELPTFDQFLKLVDIIETAPVAHTNESADMVRFLAFGGFRKMEAAHVLWKHVDFDKGEITVAGDPVHGTKNSETRRVPMIPEMRELLTRLRDSRSDTEPDTRVMLVESVKKSLASASSELGIRKLSHHDLRHLFATRCIESGVDIPTVSRWLGHKDGGALAMRVYGHLRDQHSAEMAKRVSFSRKAPENVVELPKREVSNG